MRKFHIKYGWGKIISDPEGLCKESEVMFKPDDGMHDKCVPADSVYAFHKPATYDIVDKKDLFDNDNPDNIYGKII